MDPTTVTAVVIAFAMAVAVKFGPSTLKADLLSRLTRAFIHLLRLFAFIASVGKSGRLPHQATLEAMPPLDERCVSLKDLGAEPEYDFVVIGAGPGGLAAVRQLVKDASAPSVLVIEAGQSLALSAATAELPIELSPLRLPAFCGVARHPKHGFANAAGDRGRGMGGSSLIDCGVVYAPTSEAEWAAMLPNSSTAALRAAQQDVSDHCIRTWPVCFASPLSSTFRDTLLAVPDDDEDDDDDSNKAEDDNADVERPLPLFDSRCIRAVERATDDVNAAAADIAPRDGALRGVIQPYACRLEPALGGAKTLLSHELMRDVPRDRIAAQVDVLLGTMCRGLNTTTTGKGHRVSSVAFDNGKDATTRVRVRRGVVVAAGAAGSPSLICALHSASPTTTAVVAASRDGITTATTPRDALTTPLIYQARPGLTVDAVNAHTLVAILKHAANTPDYSSVAAAHVAGRVDEVARRGASLVSVLPWDSQVVLSDVSCFVEGAADVSAALRTTTTSVLVELMACGGCHHELFEAQGWPKNLALFKEAFTFRVTALPPPTIVSDPVLVKQAMINATVHALRWCREVVRTADLSQLTTGRELLDLDLMKKLGVNVADGFKLLYKKPTAAQRRNRAAVVAHAANVFRAINDCAVQDPYLLDYVGTYARPACRGCATIPRSALADGSDVLVRDVSNLVIGDASVVREVTTGGGATIMTAAVVGTIAAKALLQATA